MGIGGALTAAFFSPLPFILAMLAGGICALAGRRRAGFWVAAAAALSLTAASLEPVHDALLLPLENRSPPLPASAVPSLDAIVVLGGGVSEGSPELGGEASLSPEALKRLAYGYVLSRGCAARLFVSGGRVTRRQAHSEAEAARLALLSFGVAGDRIVAEGESRTTWENARLVAPLLKGAGAREIALVTSAFHMPRSLLAFSRAGIRCFPAPTDYLTQRVRYGPSSFFPSFHALAESFAALREYAALAAYRVRR